MINKLLLLPVMVIVAMSSCVGQKDNNNCVDRVCTMEFRSIQVKFVNRTGQSIKVTDFRAINKRTNKILSEGTGSDFTNIEESYIKSTDTNLKDLSVEGDSVIVTAKI